MYDFVRVFFSFYLCFFPVNEKENGKLSTKKSIKLYWDLLKSSEDSPKDDTKRTVIISSKLIHILKTRVKLKIITLKLL